LKSAPRLLPLVAVAAVGVLAINALENGPGVIGAARSFAEGLTTKGGHKPAAKSDSADAPDQTDAAAPPAVVPAKPAPVCAESAAQIAKDAGLSPAELQVLQSLGARRGELDQREQGLDTQLALISAAETKVDAKIQTMNALKADMQGLLGQMDAKQEEEVDRLVKVFEAMKPQDSAARFVLLADDVRLPIAAKMKERSLSAMLAKMPPPEAKRLTESLAARFVAQTDAARQAINPPPATAAAAAAATPAPATQTAAAATPAAAPPAKPVHRKPHPPAHKPALAKAAAPPEKTDAAPAPASAKPAKETAAPAAPATPSASAPATGKSG